MTCEALGATPSTKIQKLQARSQKVAQKLAPDISPTSPVLQPGVPAPSSVHSLSSDVLLWTRRASRAEGVGIWEQTGVLVLPLVEPARRPHGPHFKLTWKGSPPPKEVGGGGGQGGCNERAFLQDAFLLWHPGHPCRGPCISDCLAPGLCVPKPPQGLPAETFWKNT